MRHSDSNLYATTVATLPGGYAKPYSLCKSTASGVLLSIRTGKYDQSEKGDRLAEEVALARSLRRSDDKAYASYKKTMPCVCWAVSEFNGCASVENIIRFSGYVYFDVDKMEYAKAKSLVLKSELRPYVVRMWKSVGGSGLGGLVWAPWVKSAEDYKLAYAKINKLSGGILDTSCSDAARKNVISWSKEVFNLIDAEELPKPEAKPALCAVQAVKARRGSRIAAPEESKKGVVKYVPSQKSAVSENKAVEPSQKSAVSENKAVEPSQKSAVSENKAVTSGIDLTEDGVAGAPYSRIERGSAGLSECFGTFLLENGMEPMWDDPRNPYVNAYGDAWRARGAEPCSSYSFSFSTRLGVPYATARPARPSDPSSLSLSVGSGIDALRYEDTTYTKKYKLFSQSAGFAEPINEPYWICQDGVQCVKLYLPKKIRKGHRRRILFPFLINYYWKYPERLDLAHTFELVALMAARIEGVLEEKKIRDMHKSIQDMADSPDGITPGVTTMYVLFLNKSRIPAKTRMKMRNEATGSRRSADTAGRIRSFVLEYSGAAYLTAAVIADGLGIGVRTVNKQYTDKEFKKLVKARNEELGLHRAKPNLSAK